MWVSDELKEEYLKRYLEAGGDKYFTEWESAGWQWEKGYKGFVNGMPSNDMSDARWMPRKLRCSYCGKEKCSCGAEDYQ